MSESSREVVGWGGLFKALLLLAAIGLNHVEGERHLPSRGELQRIEGRVGSVVVEYGDADEPDQLRLQIQSQGRPPMSVLLDDTALAEQWVPGAPVMAETFQQGWILSRAVEVWALEQDGKVLRRFEETLLRRGPQLQQAGRRNLFLSLCLVAYVGFVVHRACRRRP